LRVVAGQYDRKRIEVRVEPVRLKVELLGDLLGRCVQVRDPQATLGGERVDILRGERVLIGEHHCGPLAGRL
jgi:hypothetical protein